MKIKKVNARKIKDRDSKVGIEISQSSSQQKGEFKSKLLTPDIEWNCHYLLRSYMAQ